MKTKLSELSVKRLRKVAAAILAEPHLYDQDKCSPLDRESLNCGTPACILGWAVHLFPTKSLVKLVRRSLGVSSNAGAIALKISSNAAHRLYYKDEWPLIFQEALAHSDCPRVRACVAAARIEHFVRTNGRE